MATDPMICTLASGPEIGATMPVLFIGQRYPKADVPVVQLSLDERNPPPPSTTNWGANCEDRGEGACSSSAAAISSTTWGRLCGRTQSAGHAVILAADGREGVRQHCTSPAATGAAAPSVTNHSARL